MTQQQLKDLLGAFWDIESYDSDSISIFLRDIRDYPDIVQIVVSIHGPFLAVMGRSPRYLGTIDSSEELLSFVNQWNTKKLLPDAYVITNDKELGAIITKSISYIGNSDFNKDSFYAMMSVYIESTCDFFRSLYKNRINRNH